MPIKDYVSGRMGVLNSIAKHVPFSPNTITLLSVFFAFLFAYCIYMYEFFYAMLFAFLAFVCDGLDGLVARATGKVSRFGAFFDGVFDRIVEFIILSSLMFLSWPNLTVAYLSILISIGFGTFLTSFVKAYSDHRGAVRKEDLPNMKCVLERAERVILVFISVVVYPFNQMFSMYIISAIALLSIVSFMQRFFYVYNYKR